MIFHFSVLTLTLTLEKITLTLTLTLPAVFKRSTLSSHCILQLTAQSMRRVSAFRPLCATGKHARFPKFTFQSGYPSLSNLEVPLRSKLAIRRSYTSARRTQSSFSSSQPQLWNWCLVGAVSGSFAYIFRDAVFGGRSSVYGQEQPSCAAGLWMWGQRGALGFEEAELTTPHCVQALSHLGNFPPLLQRLY